MNAALNYWKITFSIGSTRSETVVPAMSNGDARRIFAAMMPEAKIISCLHVAGPGMRRRTPDG